MPQHSEHEIEVFNAALELPSAERAAYLDRVCAGEPALRQRVEDLLQADAAASVFLEGLAAVPSERSQTVQVPVVPAEKPGDRIGRYKLLQQIGEGGCGVVYMAEQEEPVRRKVALKVIKLGMDTKSVIARFEAERQALAMMDHPNIARVLDAGATETGRPYFVMELVRGIKITQYCDQNNFTTRERLEIFVQVCRAIQHAHQKGVIHRDIKPSNILVTVNDGMSVPKVIDFGIAKATQGRLTDLTLFTAFEQFIGTPAYMSPEQAVMTSLDVDTRSDIYSLGVLLYELLTGRTPFDNNELIHAGLDEMRRIIREKEPARPSTRVSTLLDADRTTVAKQRQTEAPKLIHALRGDLDWIAMKALEKERTRRYETANGLAMDVQRHLNGELVLARPPTNFYKFQKTVRRHKMAFAGATVITAALVLALVVALAAAFRIQRDYREIRTARDDATEKLWGSYLAEARAQRASAKQGQRFASLTSVRNAAAIRRDLRVRNEAIACLAMSDLRVSKEFVLKGYSQTDLVRYDLNLERYVLGGVDGSLTIRATADDRVLAVLPAPGFRVVRVRDFSPNGHFLRVMYKGAGENYSDWFWDLEKQTPVLREQPTGMPMGLIGDLAGNPGCSFSSDNRLLARCNLDGTLSIYDLDSGAQLKHLPGARLFNGLVLNPGNTQLACSSETDPAVEIRDVQSGRAIRTFNCPSGVSAIAWSPDGKRLATACLDHRIYTWDAATGQREPEFEGHTADIISLAFNHAGNLLASASFEELVRLWDAQSGRQLASHPGSSWQLQFSPDDRQLSGWVNADHYGSLEVGYSREFRLLYAKRYGDAMTRPNFSADGHILAAGALDQIRFWDVFSGNELGSFLVEQFDNLIFHPDGRSLLVIDRTAGIWRRSLDRIGDPSNCVCRLGKPTPIFLMSGLRSPVVSRDGRYLAVGHEEAGEAFVINLQDTSAKPVPLRPHSMAGHLAISPDGRWVATASWHNPLVKVWDAQSGELEQILHMPDRTTVTFSPDDKWLATSTIEYRLWEVGSWRPRGPAVPGCPVAERNGTAFSPDARIIARVLEGNKIELLDTRTEKPLAILDAPGSVGIGGFEFSPDGAYLAAVQAGQQVQLWDLRLIRQELAQMGLDWDMPAYPSLAPEAKVPTTLEIEADDGQPAPGR
jgi:serine/threonine protein kinase/WD40 repeat protein